jgi:hypothetical protein
MEGGWEGEGGFAMCVKIKIIITGCTATALQHSVKMHLLAGNNNVVFRSGTSNRSVTRARRTVLTLLTLNVLSNKKGKYFHENDKHHRKFFTILIRNSKRVTVNAIKASLRRYLAVM